MNCRHFGDWLISKMDLKLESKQSLDPDLQYPEKICSYNNMPLNPQYAMLRTLFMMLSYLHILQDLSFHEIFLFIPYVL